MTIYQLLPSLSFGDAIGNETIVIKKILQDSGYDTEIFALHVVPKLAKDCKYAYDLEKMAIKEDDVIIYHFSIGCSECISILKKLKCRTVMLYHNITPSNFFYEYSNAAAERSYSGRKELVEIRDCFDCCLADSEYNKQELVDLGYKCPIHVVPLIIPFEDYDKVPSGKVINQYMDDGYTNLLFVGRIAPNKKQEDIIKVFNYYKKNINPKSRLIFVGNPGGMELYYQRLQNYVGALDLEDVIFTGHIGFDEILAYYRLADIFLCMSENEGFGVPLVEAMYFNIPIIAYSSSAIPWVLGDSGVLVENKNSILWARLIDKIMQDESLRNEIIESQRNRLKDFSFENTKGMFLKYLYKFMKEDKN